MAVPLAAQLGVDAGRAIDPALGRKDAADMPAQLGVRLRAVLSGRDRAQTKRGQFWSYPMVRSAHCGGKLST